MHLSKSELEELLTGDCASDASPDKILDQRREHLASCQNCRDLLKQVSGEHELDTALTNFRELSSADSDRQSESTLINRFEFSPSSFSPGSNSETEDEEAACFPFLDPSVQPELLGTLGALGRYEIESVIASGGNGIVFKARDVELSRTVAIKVLSPMLCRERNARNRFAREAQATATVEHRNIIEIYDVCISPRVCFFVMKYAIDTLRDRVDQRGPLPAIEAIEVAIQIASGLGAAHRENLIHRDIKPSNILMENVDSCDLMISDFGLVQVSDSLQLTKTGLIAGTPAYMSPEQADGTTVGPSSDLFSLGSVLYFVLTGKSPFDSKTIVSSLHKVCFGTHDSLTVVAKSTPPALYQLVDELLEKDPSKRPQSVAEVQSELEWILNELKSGRTNPRSRRVTGTSSRFVGWAALASVVLIVALGWLTLNKFSATSVSLEKNGLTDVALKKPKTATQLEPASNQSDSDSAEGSPEKPFAWALLDDFQLAKTSETETETETNQSRALARKKLLEGKHDLITGLTSPDSSNPIRNLHVRHFDELYKLDSGLLLAGRIPKLKLRAIPNNRKFKLPIYFNAGKNHTVMASRWNGITCKLVEKNAEGDNVNEFVGSDPSAIGKWLGHAEMVVDIQGATPTEDLPSGHTYSLEAVFRSTLDETKDITLTKSNLNVVSAD